MSLRRLPISIVFAFFLALLAAPSAVSAPNCPAAGFVTSAGEAYDRAAQRGSPEAFITAASRYSNIRDMSVFALGRYRKDLPKNREAEYMKLTRRFIGAFMLDYGKDFRATSLEITDCKTSGGNIVVSGRLNGGDRVTFRVARSGGGFTVKDINMRGIWLVQQMRSTFVGKIREGGYDELFSYLKR